MMQRDRKSGGGAVALVAVLCGVSAAAAAAEGGASGPRIELERREIDFGVRKQGEVLDARFAFRNAGDAPLEIREARAGCSCTVVEFDRTIPPGGSGRVDVQLDTESLREQSMRFVTLVSNDPVEPRIELELRVRIPIGVYLLPHPKMHVLGSIDDEATEAHLLVRQHPDEAGTLRVHDLRPSVPWLAARAERLEAPRAAEPGFPEGRIGDWLVTLHSTGELPPGRSAELLTFRTGLATEPEVEIPVAVDVAVPIEADLEQLELRPPDDGSAASGVIRLRHRDPQVRKRLRAEAGDPATVVELRPWGPREMIAVVKRTGPGPARTSVTFVVGEYRLTVPVVVATPGG